MIGSVQTLARVNGLKPDLGKGWPVRHEVVQAIGTSGGTI